MPSVPSALPLLEPHMRENPSRRADEAASESPIGDYFRVIIMDNDVNTYEEVINVCMLALGVDFQHAHWIAAAVDRNGEAEVFLGPRSEAEKTAAIIRTIGIEVRIVPRIS